VSDAMLFALQVRGTETGDILVIKALAMGGRNVG
jgi:hypothetical protein